MCSLYDGFTLPVGALIELVVLALFIHAQFVPVFAVVDQSPAAINRFNPSPIV